MNFTWVYLALFSALSLAASDALAKKSVENNNEYLVALFRLMFSMPLLLVLWLFVPMPKLDTEFYVAFWIALPVELLTVILYVKALKVSPLSLTLPFLALTPVALIVVSYLLLGETVSMSGGAGIFLIAAGSYVLNIRDIRKGLLEPFRSIMREKGSVMMICVSLCYGVTSSLGKMAIEHSSPQFFGITYTLAMTLFFAPFGLWMGRHDIRAFAADSRSGTLMTSGLFYALATVTHMSAMKLAKVAYMVSVKRSSLLFGVLFGYLFFKEEGIRERLLGALLMFAGFVMVVSAK